MTPTPLPPERLERFWKRLRKAPEYPQNIEQFAAFLRTCGEGEPYGPRGTVLVLAGQLLERLGPHIAYLEGEVEAAREAFRVILERVEEHDERSTGYLGCAGAGGIEYTAEAALERLTRQTPDPSEPGA